jgi:hypothetical protein
MRVTCPKCGYKAQVPDNATGKRARCNACQEVFRIMGAVQDDAGALSGVPGADSHGTASPAMLRKPVPSGGESQEVGRKPAPPVLDTSPERASQQSTAAGPAQVREGIAVETPLPRQIPAVQPRVVGSQNLAGAEKTPAPECWGTLANALDAETVFRLHRRDAAIVAPVSVETTSAGVRVCLRVLPTSAVAAMLLGSIQAAVWAPIRLAISFFYTIYVVFAFFGILLGTFTGRTTLDVLIWPQYFMRTCFIFLLNVILVPLTWYRTIQLVRAVARKEPITYLPPGLKLKHNLVAEFPRGQPVQVLRMEVSTPFLELVTKPKTGCLMSLLFLFLAPLRLLAKLASAGLAVDVCTFAFVTGEPLDLSVPASRGEQRKRIRALQWAAIKRARSVCLVSVPPHAADAFQNTIGKSLGVDVTQADEDFLTDRIWLK